MQAEMEKRSLGGAPFRHGRRNVMSSREKPDGARHRRGYLLAAALLAVPALLAGPAGAAKAPLAAGKADGRAPDTVRVATSKVSSTSMWWGMKSIAAKHNLKLEYVEIQTFADMQRAVASGQADITSLGYPNVPMMADQGITNVKIVSGAWSGSQNLIARTGSGINDWKDLEGKRVGVVPGSYAYIMFIVAASEHDVDLNRVSLVNMAPIPASMINALDRGQIDALVWVPPTLQLIRSQGIGNFAANIDIMDNAGLGGNPVGLLAANTSFIAQTDAFTRFMRAWVETIRFYQRNPVKWSQYIAALTGVERDIARASVGRGKGRVGLNLRVSRAGLTGAARQGPVFGFTKRDQSDKVLSYVDLSTLASVLKVREATLLVN
jgi:sulfonate transport system substrate-binding protein